MKLRSHPNLLAAVPFNMEADSLNSAVLGEHVVPGDHKFELFIKEVRKEMTVKSGQKCTAVRRVFVPRSQMDNVQEALTKALSKAVMGDPQVEGVRMGALVHKEQKQNVLAKLDVLKSEAESVCAHTLELVGGEVVEDADVAHNCCATTTH